MSEEKFPLPGSSYKELSKVIAAYAEVTGPTAPGPVGQIAVVHETVVSRNNKFLVAAGLIDGGQKKTCTPLGVRLGRAIQHEQDEAIGEAWAEVVSHTDFLQKIISAVRIRKGMEESALASHIAFTSGSPKNAYARAGAGSLIEILKLSGSIAAEGSTFVARSSERNSSEESNSIETLSPLHISREPLEPVQKTAPLAPVVVAGAAVELRINLNITCSVTELSGLGPQLRKLKEDFERSALEVASDDAGSSFTGSDEPTAPTPLED